MGMANFHVIAGASDTPESPIVRRIGLADLKEVLKKGFADFWAMPNQVFFLALIYPIAGVILAGFAFDQNMLPLLYPLASGFALVGPFVSIGLYELSRRREQGLLCRAEQNQARGRWKFRPLRRPLAEALANQKSRDEKALRPIRSSQEQRSEPLIRGGRVA